jgi:hypothetical protein
MNFRRAGDPDTHTRIQQFEMAMRMQASVPELTAIENEPESTYKLYGEAAKKPGSFAYTALLARRLIERGVRFVQIYGGGGHNDENWDAHGDVDANHLLHASETDRPIAGLIKDLKRRGLLDSTLIVWGGEFGRQPVSQNGAGRDHNPKGFCVWLAGGGIQGGIAVGETDDLGHEAVADRYHVHDLHATILHQLGIDHDGEVGGKSVRAAQYVRMSTEHQKYSTENQAEAMQQYAARRGMEIVRTYADEGKSGLRLDGRGVWLRGDGGLFGDLLVLRFRRPTADVGGTHAGQCVRPHCGSRRCVLRGLPAHPPRGREALHRRDCDRLMIVLRTWRTCLKI